MRKNGKYYIFLFVFMMYFVPRYLEYTTFAKIEYMTEIINALKMIAYVLAAILLMMQLMMRKKSIKYLIVFFCILLYFTYQGFVENRNSVFVVVLLSSIFDEKYFDKFISDILRLSIVLYISTIFSCWFGFIENVYTTRNKFNSQWIAGGNGFVYSGQMMMMLIPIVFMYYYKKRGKITLLDNIFWLSIDAFIFSKSLTIMGFVLIIFFIVIINILEHRRKHNNVTMLKRKNIVLMPFVFFAIDMILLWIYNKFFEVGQVLDVLFNGRLNLGNIMIKNYGIKMFGTSFFNNTNYGYYEILDSEYVYMIVGDGVIYTIIGLILLCCVVKYAQKKNDIYLVSIWIMVLFNAIFNNGIFNLVMNPFSIILTISIKDMFVNRKYNKFH